MKGRGSKFRLSPNEEARIIREEKERRRKLRIVQVREQAKANAAKIRQAVKDERNHQLSLLAAEIKDEWEQEKAEKVRKLQELHLRSLRHVGDAHVNASQHEPRDVENALIAQQNLQKAAQRHLEALHKMKEEKERKEKEARQHILARQVALDTEKERAAIVAAMPPPEPDPVKDVEVFKVKPIKLTDVNAFSLTHYHMPMEEYAVERAQPAEQTDAKAAAQEEQERIDHLEETERVAAHERQEKARLRHQHARRKEVLRQDYDAMMLDLSDLRRTDITRRQQGVAKIPKSVYQAPQRRQEEKEEDQKDMEAAFEDVYMAATDRRGDLTLALDPHPPPAVTPAGSTVLDLSLDPATMERVPPGSTQPQHGAPRAHPLKDLTNLSNRSLQQMAEGKANHRLSSSFPQSPVQALWDRIERKRESALGRLMSRIQSQRDAVAKPASAASESPQEPRVSRPFAPVERDVSSTAGTLTQYTLTSGDQPSRSSVSTLEESSLGTVSSVSTMTGSGVSSSVTSSSRRSGASSSTVTSSSLTVTESDVTNTSSSDTLEEGTVSSTTEGRQTATPTLDMDTLLHPMEMAAKVRQKSLDHSTEPMASFLDQKKLTNQPNLDQLVSDFRLEQQRLEKVRKDLEKKMKELESQAPTSLHPPPYATTPLELAQKYLQELPPLSEPERTPAPYTPTLEDARTDLRGQGSSGLTQEDKVRIYKQRALERGSVPTQGSSELAHADKVRLYKQRALDRAKERQRSKDPTEDSLLRQGMGSSAVTRGPTTDQALSTHSLADMGKFEDVSMTSSDPFSILGSVRGLSLSTSFPTGSFSVGQQQVDRSGNSGLSGGQDHSYGSAGMSSTYPSLDIDSRQAALKAQLSDIQRQKTDIQLRQQRHQDEMQQLKERWQSELDQYKLMDSLTSDRDFSGLTGFSGGISDTGVMNGQFQSQPYEENLEDELLSHLNNLPPQATDHKYKIQRKKPGSKVIKVPNKSPMMPHELSTIQEMETPATEKKIPTAPRPMNSTELSLYDTDRRPIARSLFDDQPPSHMAPLAEVDDSGVPTYPSQPEFPPYRLNQVPNERPLDLDLPQTPQQLSQHFTKEPSEGDMESVFRNDFADPSSDVNWNVATWVGLESKVVERPMPSIDRVQEVQRLPHETPGELVIPSRAPLPPAEDYSDQQAHTAGLSVGRDTEDSEYHPYSGGITIGPSKDDDDREEMADEEDQDQASARLLRRLHGDPDTDKENDDQNTPQKYVRGPPRAPPTDTPPKFEFNSLYVPLQSPKDKNTWKQELAQYHQSYLTPPKMSPARSTDKIVRCITTRAFGCERPIKEGEKPPPKPEIVNRRSPPKTPTKGQESPEENFTPSRIREMFEKNVQEPLESPILKDKPPRGFNNTNAQFLSSTPSSTKASSRLEYGEAGKEPIVTPTESVVPKTGSSGSRSRPGGTSLASNDTVTPGERSAFSELSQYRLESEADSTKTPANLSAKTNASLEQGPLSASSVRSENAMSLREGRLSASGTRNETAMSLSQGLLSEPGIPNETGLSLSQGPLSVSGYSAPGPTANFTGERFSGEGLPSVRQESTSFRPIMEVSQSSEGSAFSNQKSPYQGGVYVDPQPMGQAGWKAPYAQYSEPRSMGAYGMDSVTTGQIGNGTQGSATGLSQIDYAREISKRAEAAMERYDRQMEESRKLRKTYEAEEQALMEETAVSGTQPAERSVAWDQHLNKSLERLAQEETGISDEPDLTLVSVSSTPQKVLPESTPSDPTTSEPAPIEPTFASRQYAKSRLLGGLDTNTPDQPGSLLSFEQHEQSLATMSQVSLIRPSLSDEQANSAFPPPAPIDNEPLTPYASTSSATGSSLGASGHTGSNGNKALAKDSQVTGATQGKSSKVQEDRRHLSQTLASWKKNNSLQAQSSMATGPTTVVSTTVDASAAQKKKEREMKERTERLYGQLEDVKQHRQDKQRQETYATNRQRKLEYQKNYQEQLKKKMQGKKN